MLAARLAWVGPSFLSTIRQETPWRLSSAAMNRPTGPAPTTNTWVSVAIRYPLVPVSRADPTQSRPTSCLRYSCFSAIRSTHIAGHASYRVVCGHAGGGSVVIGGDAESQA